MKRFNLMLIVLLAPLLFLIGCNEKTSSDTVNENGNDIQTEENPEINDNEDKNDENSNESSNEGQTDDMQMKMDELDYTDFELEVKYSGNKEYEAEIEQGSDGVKAELEDELNNINLKGEEAFNKIYPKVSELTITQDTNMNDAIQEVIDIFRLDPDYEKIEVEITFKDGSKIEYEDKKTTK